MNNKDTFDILHGEFDDCPEQSLKLYHRKRNQLSALKSSHQ